MDQRKAIAELADDDEADRRIRYVIRGRPGQDDRPSLPAGHPATWGAITSGTIIDGAKYPFPVFVS